MKLYRPEKIYIETDARDLPLTKQIRERLADVPCEEVSDTRTLQAQIRASADPIGAGKRYLLLAYDRGRSFKPFPEAEQYLSCDYFTLHLAEGCDMECSYCILQSYLTNPLLTVYVNVDEMLGKLQSVLDENPDRFFRIGTGQLADSLSLDHITGFSEILIPYFARQQNAVLELKTKSDNIDRLLKIATSSPSPLPLRGGEDKGEGVTSKVCNTIISWSMNSAKIEREEEHKTSSIEERIAAAKKCARAGYRVGFHFDPIIDYPGWKQDYEEVVRDIFENIPANQIAWISLGCLRFMPELKKILSDRFPKSKLPTAEWIRGMDGKLRYFKPRRVEIYREMVGMIREMNSNITLYLSMESPEVWNLVFGGNHNKETVCRLLDNAGRSVHPALTL